jgi:TonB family protein
LKLLLASWRTEDAPAALSARVINSYRQLRSRTAEEGAEMKRCPSCHKEFAPQFRFCPLDGLPLVSARQMDARAAAPSATPQQTGAHTIILSTNDARELKDASADSPLTTNAALYTHAALPTARGEYQLTMLAETGLLARLSAEVRAVGTDAQLTWPELRRDPVGFARRTLIAYGLLLRRRLVQENVAYGLVTACVVVLTLICTVVALDRYHRTHPVAVASNIEQDYELLGWIPTDTKPDAGPAGMAQHGTGGGSLQNHERPGGGGGGNHETLPANGGKLPPGLLTPPIVAPNPHPPTIQNPHLPMSASLQADPVLFPPDPRPLPYGDPKSQATELSSGAGDGGGIGDGTGGGVGPGNGTGYGPGEGWNTGGGPAKLGGGGPGCCGGDYEHTIFKQHDVTKRAIITYNPEPTFTEEARKNNTIGEVTLRLVLTSSGTVSNIIPVKRLPDGLTEKAIEAAHQIKFIPAEKDGHKVSQYATIVYNFNIY